MKRRAIAATMLGSWLMVLAVLVGTEWQAEVRLLPLGTLQGLQVVPVMLAAHP
jgi:hypothetical protein